MKQEVKVPEIGESITGGILTAWLHEDGERVEEGQDLFELETREDGRIKVLAETNQTSNPFIFAAGSCVERVDSVIEAVAKGQLAARRIVRELLNKE